MIPAGSTWFNRFVVVAITLLVAGSAVMMARQTTSLVTGGDAPPCEGMKVPFTDTWLCWVPLDAGEPQPAKGPRA